MSIPTLDASALSGGTAEQRAEFAAKLLDSLNTFGFAKLVNHTVPVPLVQETFDQIKRFFKLPFNVKVPLRNDPKKGQQRGWSVPGEEKTWWLESNTGDVKEPNFGDNKESFDCGHPDDQKFPNKWPSESDLPGYQKTMDEFFFSCGDLTLVLLESMATALNLDPKVFTSRCTNEASTIRINHFPPIERATLDEGKISRIWPHKDFGIISLVFPDVTPGLEYEDRSNPGTFIPMPYGSDEEVVVIVSETMQRWTNNQIPGGLHRVTRPRDCEGETVPERWSLVYFNKADRDVNVGPLDEFLGDKKPVYEDLTALEYQTLRNAAHYPG
ncbi:Oxoglutarate/iron-dependent dioxygenase [Penicillium pulvis]|uniref:Oxoglutarate/iron-dependent dioxygenase n=1 Tax=Penicillium pulvis TaxID=1562058 RepID=UPI00254728D0|nr:Oxoglutarate/iron-dependent dioxygenase [Penicillium pulvis]KAJ5798352.1 Oxoglutarate/iron-dependent dioxygenase [Penicillium pulvis]